MVRHIHPLSDKAKTFLVKNIVYTSSHTSCDGPHNSSTVGKLGQSHSIPLIIYSSFEQTGLRIGRNYQAAKWLPRMAL